MTGIELIMDSLGAEIRIQKLKGAAYVGNGELRVERLQKNILRKHQEKMTKPFDY